MPYNANDNIELDLKSYSFPFFHQYIDPKEMIGNQMEKTRKRKAKEAFCMEMSVVMAPNNTQCKMDMVQHTERRRKEKNESLLFANRNE